MNRKILQKYSIFVFFVLSVFNFHLKSDAAQWLPLQGFNGISYDKQSIDKRGNYLKVWIRIDNLNSLSLVMIDCKKRIAWDVSGGSLATRERNIHPDSFEEALLSSHCVSSWSIFK